MTRQRRSFDPGFKLAVGKMIKEQGLSVQHVSESIALVPAPSVGGCAVCRRAVRPARHWQTADGRAAANPAIGAGESPVARGCRYLKKASAFFARALK